MAPSSQRLEPPGKSGRFNPETLKAFLKEIDGFSYDHSERLGDAFEYLLSVLGSQGDAGQFRTPRHIIDFVVRVINPQKHERILDPACGTAGFLISAWKYILEQNKAHKPGDKLTPDERNKLAANIHGYDISPDMVRLSLVNLYLHGFTDPHVDEYDTLTSEDKWNEHADVILANPPFMSPKGGIKPHKRFSIQATRSEVLFVDYIHEHLSPNGRAGIIVPEGIIFQSGTAYKALRKLLVQNSLVAVVSLPAGVFQPYSGVKTSILILDKRLAKQADKVLFVKVSNDGFTLGAQRRPTEQDDLPQAEQALSAFCADPAGFDGRALAQAVEREKITENGEWSLSADRYVQAAVAISQYKQVEIGSVIETITPPAKIQKESYLSAGRYPIIDQSQNEIAGFTNDETAIIYPEKPFVIFGDHTCAVKIVSEPFAQGADGIKIIRTSGDLLPEFLFNFLKNHPLETDGYKRHFADLKRKNIPIPPVDIQREIVAEIKGYQKVIDGARQVLENYSPRITVAPEWPMVPLGEVSSTSSGGTPSKQNPDFWKGSIPWVSPKDMKTDLIADAEDHISEAAIEGSATRLVPPGTVLCVVRSGILQHSLPVGLTVSPVAFNQDITAITADEKRLSAKYLFFALKSFAVEILEKGIKPGVTVQSFHSGFFKSYQIPLPDLSAQREVVEDLEAEQALINANKELIARFEAKIKAVIDRVWAS